jgi:integrase|tara:strand:- start:888 stop:1805 length:918 start_codon:yes stop_codon:yes gene_type:complete
MNIPKASASLREIISFYLNSPGFGRLAGSTQKDYETHLAAVCKTVVEGKALGDYRHGNIKVRHLTQAYEAWLSVGVRTANYRKSVLSATWKHSMRHDVMTHDPVALIETTSEEVRRVMWSREQLQTFLSVSYGDFRWRSIGLIVHMAYDWGQRVGDMRVLKWDRLDLTQCRLDLTQSKRNAEVHLPISESLCSMLRQQKEDFGFQDYVAPNVKIGEAVLKTYTKVEIGIKINEVLAKANLPMHLTAMDLRRTAVTEMMEGAVDLGGIMQVTGHKNIASLKPYMVNTYSGASKALAARGNDKDEHS